MRKLSFSALAALMLVTASAGAQVTQSLGAGSAVTSVQASASFESMNALNDNPYIENGLRFSRTNMTFDNNGCGYANAIGCASTAALTGFQGNYMYGNGVGGYFSMMAPTGQRFSGLEFRLGNGYGDATKWNVSWTAFLGGVQLNTGSLATLIPGNVIGFSSVTGFDELRYTDLNTLAAPAFDEVRAQFVGGTVVTPEPATWALMASGLLVVGGFTRRKRRAN